MQIISNNINFKSRNPEIRFADDIARRVNQCYPRVSSTLVCDMKNSKRTNFIPFIRKLGSKVNMLRDIMGVNIAMSHDGVSSLKVITDLIKKHKVGNCAESAALASIAARVNGLKKTTTAAVFTDYGRNLDHAVVLVPNNGKPYVIDSWLGFADYVPKAVERYHKEYNKHFDLFFGNDKIEFKRCSYPELCYLDIVPARKIRAAFPELRIKRKS